MDGQAREIVDLIGMCMKGGGDVEVKSCDDTVAVRYYIENDLVLLIRF